MKKYHLTILMLIGIWLKGYSQTPDTLYLEYIQNQARINYPLIKQNSALIESNLLRIKNYRANFYPKTDLNAQATYQSDVTSVSLASPTIDFTGILPPGAPKPTIIMPSVPNPDKDQYKITLDVNQMIYDGGLTKKQISLENATLASDTMKTEVDLYQIKDRVNQTFFSILLIQEKMQLIKLLQNDLILKLKLIESTTKNGVTTEADVLILKAEMIKINQQITELEFSKKAALNILSIFINQKIPDNIGFKVDSPILIKQEIKRPEINWFSLQKNRIDYTAELIKAKKMPKIFGFAQAGYGKPGLNMFKNEFSDFYLVGAKLTWNIWDWNQNKRDREILTFQKEIIQNQQDVFIRNIQIASENEIANIEKNEMLLNQDKELIQLREQISKTTFSQVENGIKTMDDYIYSTNNELNTKINYQIHLLQSLQAKINYNTLYGNEK